MKKIKLVIALLVVVVCIGLYTKFVPQPLARDVNDGLSVLELSDMNELVIMDYESDKTYRTTDRQQFEDVHSELMKLKVTRGEDTEIDSDIMRDDEALIIRFFNSETMSAISYTFYENGDLFYKQQAMFTKITMGRHVSEKELARVKALVLEGMTMD